MNSVWLLVAGYIGGHLIQPLSSGLGKLLETLCGMRAAHEEVSSAFSSTDREMLIIAKQHAEVVGMVATGISCLIVLAGQRIGLAALIISEQPLPIGTTRFNNWFLVISSIVFFGFALERARTARQRCLRLKFRPEFKEYSDRIATGGGGQILADTAQSTAIPSEIESS